MAGEKRHYPISVFTEGDTIACYRGSQGELCHTGDLTKAREPFLFLSISDGLIPNKIPPDFVLKAYGTTSEALLKELTESYSANAGTAEITRCLRDGFYTQYDKLPPIAKAFTETWGGQIIIAREGSTLENLGVEKGTSAIARQLHKYMLFTASASRNFGTVLEEFGHNMDAWVAQGRGAPRFSLTRGWKNAVKHDLEPPNSLATALYDDFRAESGKGNSAFSLAVADPSRPIEALADIMRMEHSLMERMRSDGNLTALSEEINPGDGIDDVMRRAMPNLWQLYRGPSKGHRLMQNKEGDVVEIARGAKQEGFRPVISYTEACGRLLRPVGRGDDAVPASLPGPTNAERLPPMPKITEAGAQNLWRELFGRPNTNFTGKG